MTRQELCRKGFISQEQYDWAVKTIAGGENEFPPAGAGGCYMTPYGTEKVKQYQARMMAGQEGGWGDSVRFTPYPPECFLNGLLPENVFDQGQRGSCVAQSVTALANCYFGKNQVLSPEYTYAMLKAHEMNAFSEACKTLLSGNTASVMKKYAAPDNVEQYKQNDLRPEWKDMILLQLVANVSKVPGSQIAQFLPTMSPQANGGSRLAIACDVFRQEGFCSFETLPYSRQVIPGNEGHLPVPEDALEDASHRRIRDELHYFTSPGSVDGIKKFLTGNSGKWAPMPVAIGVPCFPSWACNPYCAKSGWFCMPFKEECKNGALGGHAMLIVGYVDEEMIPGGGFFLVRNSWSSQWAWESDYPGHAKIPYAFIETFCGEAMSIVAPPDYRDKLEFGYGGTRAKTGKPAAADHSTPASSGHVSGGNGAMSAAAREQDLNSARSVYVLYRGGETTEETLYLVKHLIRDGYSVRVSRQGSIVDRDAIKACTDCIVMLSPGMFGSGQGAAAGAADKTIMKNIEYAASLGKRIVPVAPDGYALPREGQLPKGLLLESGRDVTKLAVHSTAFRKSYSRLRRQLVSEAGTGAPAGKGILGANNQQNAGPTDNPDLLSKLASRSLALKILILLLKRGFHTADGGQDQKKTQEILSSVSAGKECDCELVHGDIAVQCSCLSSGGPAIFRLKRQPAGSGAPFSQNVRELVSGKSFYHGLNQIFRHLPHKHMAQSFVQDITADDFDEEPAHEKAVAGNTEAPTLVPEEPAPHTSDETNADAEVTTDTTATQPGKPEAAKQVRQVRTAPQMQTDAKAEQERCLVVKNSFLQGVDSNLKKLSVDYCFPGFNFPVRYRYLPWQIQVKEVLDRTSVHGDLSKIWMNKLVQKGLIDANGSTGETTMSSFAVYELKNGGISFLVISAFVARIVDGVAVSLTPGWMDALQELKDEVAAFAARKYCQSPSAIGIVVGTPADIQNWQDYQGGANQFVLYCTKSAPEAEEPDSEWKFHFPVGIHGVVWDNFITHLLPLNNEQLADSLQRALERMWKEELGTMTMAKLYKRWDMPLPLFRKTFHQLRKRDVFKVTKEEILKNDPQTDLFSDIQPYFLSGAWGFVTFVFWQYIYQIINTLFMTIGLYICIGSNASARYKVSTVLVLALTGLVSSLLVKIHERKPWRK